MEYGIITFRSITPAQQGEGVLRRAGVSCAMQRTPRWMEQQGCGYCLRVASRYTASAVQLLQAKQIPYRKVYQRRADGSIGEMAL